MQNFIANLSSSEISFLNKNANERCSVNSESEVISPRQIPRPPAQPCNSVQPTPKTFSARIGRVPSRDKDSYSRVEAAVVPRISDQRKEIQASSNEDTLMSELRSFSNVLGEMGSRDYLSSTNSSSGSDNEGPSPVNKNTFRVVKPVEIVADNNRESTNNYAQIFATQYDGKHFASLKNCPLLRKDNLTRVGKKGQRRTSALCFVESHQKAVERDHLPIAQPRLDVVALNNSSELQRTESYQNDIEVAFNGASHMIFKDIKKCMDATSTGENALSSGEISALYSKIIFSYSAIQLKDKNVASRTKGTKSTGGQLISMRDEIFLQMMKQLQLNPSARSFLKGWKLLKLMCIHQAKRMSVELLPFVKAFVLMACKDFQNHEENDKFRAEVFSYAEASWKILSEL